MSSKDLKNKPLVEVILEIKWALSGPPTPPGLKNDPNYRILLGRFSERVEKEYPAYEQLPSAQIPDGMAPQVVQHRFRVDKGKWPLVQLGPGVLSVNDTATYTWTDFEPRCQRAVQELFDAYPAKQDLRIENMSLRFIDAEPLDFEKFSVFSFLRDKMKLQVMLPDIFFGDTGVNGNPVNFNWQSSFLCEKPKGRATIRFASGKRDDRPALIWETLVQAAGSDLPAMPTGFNDWLADAHTLTDDWFFKLIEGELERKYSGE